MSFFCNNNYLNRKNSIETQQEKQEEQQQSKSKNKKTYHIYKEVKISIIVSLYLTIDEIIKEIKKNPTLKYYKVVTSKRDENN